MDYDCILAHCLDASFCGLSYSKSGACIRLSPSGQKSTAFADPDDLSTYGDKLLVFQTTIRDCFSQRNPLIFWLAGVAGTLSSLRWYVFCHGESVPSPVSCPLLLCHGESVPPCLIPLLLCHGEPVPPCLTPPTALSQGDYPSLPHPPTALSWHRCE